MKKFDNEMKAFFEGTEFGVLLAEKIAKPANYFTPEKLNVKIECEFVGLIKCPICGTYHDGASETENDAIWAESSGLKHPNPYDYCCEDCYILALEKIGYNECENCGKYTQYTDDNDCAMCESCQDSIKDIIADFQNKLDRDSR